MEEIREPAQVKEVHEPTDQTTHPAWSSSARATVDDAPELAAMCGLPCFELLTMAWKDQGAEFSLPRDALAFQAGTFRHLSRLSRLWGVHRVIALGTGEQRLSKLAPGIRQAGYDAARAFAADVVRVAVARLREPQIAAFDHERRRLTAEEMAFLSHEAAAGAVTLAFIGAACPDGADASAAEKLKAALVRLPPMRRAMALTATESAMTREAQAAEDLLTHEELADIFSRDETAISKAISKDKRSIERRLRKSLLTPTYE